MTDETIDLLQIKIEKAKRELPLETINAISAVDWKTSILELRAKKGYTFEQLGELELETELVLCGLVRVEDYPKELEKRMGISKVVANELVNEMNNLVFRKIREELVKNTERKKVFANKIENNGTTVAEEISKEITPNFPPTSSTQMQEEKLEIKGEVPPILAQKFSGFVKIPTVKTEHTLENITKNTNINDNNTIKNAKIDPYREIPE